MKDRTITVTWDKKFQLYDIQAETLEGEGVHKGEALLLSLTLSEMEQFMVSLAKANIARVKQIKTSGVEE